MHICVHLVGHATMSQLCELQNAGCKGVSLINKALGSGVEGLLGAR